jgi:eukaryotic-like serine/threonine-protein kinase
VDAEEVRLAGRRLAGRYELEEEIASGGMGTVWRAHDGVLGRPVAVKVLHDHLARDPDLLDRFRREAVAAARLNHPAIVRVFDTGIDEGICFIIMELFEGRTLQSVLAERGPLEPVEATRVVGGALHGLGHAHREDVIHRDVKPGNILLDLGGSVKVTDFGIAKAAFAGDDLTTTGNLLGTSRYLAPEQVTGGPVDGRTDLYSTGVVLYEALTGRAPFEADTNIATATKRLTTDPVPPRALRSGISRPLDQVVMRALAREPDDRYASAEEMTEALERAVGAQPAPQLPPERPGPPRVASSSVRSWFLVPLLVLVVAALAVGGFWLLGQVLDEGGLGENGDSGPGPSEGQSLRTTAVSSFDPVEGGGDGTEHDDEIGSATDGDPSTFWTTEGYRAPNMDKDGVGIVLEISDATEATGLTIQTDTPGFAFGLYGSDAPDGFDLTSDPLAEDTADAVTEVELSGLDGSYLLIWLTELPLDGDAYRAHINEVEVLGG